LPKDNELPFHLFIAASPVLPKTLRSSSADFDHAFERNPVLLQVQVGKALSDAIEHRESEGLEILRIAEEN
jgi:hypothetical protein